MGFLFQFYTYSRRIDDQKQSNMIKILHPNQKIKNKKKKFNQQTKFGSLNTQKSITM